MSGNDIYLLNPHKLGTKGRKAKTESKAMARTAKKKSTGRKPRTAAQKAATAKMVAANRRRRAAKKAPSSSHGTAAKKRRSYARASAPAAPKRRHYRRNPVATKSGIVGQLVHDIAIPAGIGTGGALGIDALWGNLKFLPLTIRAGKVKYLAKPAIAAGGAILAGMFAPKLKKVANKVAEITLAVNAHAAATEIITAKFPNAGLAGYGDDELNAVVEELNGLEGGLGADLMLSSPGENLGGLEFYAPAYDSANV